MFVNTSTLHYTTQANISFQTNYSQEQLADPSTQISCAVTALKDFHRDMAFTFSTSFLHPKLYAQTRPKAITDVFAACVMYACKTPATEAHIRSIIEDNVMRLIREHPVQQATLELALARVQSMLLYQTMRGFDGDIRLRANAENNMDLLQSWNRYLTELRDCSDDIRISTFRDQEIRTPKSWQVSLSQR